MQASASEGCNACDDQGDAVSKKRKQTSRPLITPAEAARRLGLDQVSDDPGLVVRKMARRGDLRPVKVSRWTMIDPDSVDEYMGREPGAED